MTDVSSSEMVLLRLLQEGRLALLPSVFLSSSATDIGPLRIAIAAYLHDQKFDLENFQTRPEAHKLIQDRIVEDIRRTRLFVLLLGSSYGSPSVPDPSVSWTHFEWRTAVQEKKPRLAFLHERHLPEVREQTPTCCDEAQTRFIDEIEKTVPGTHFRKLINDTQVMPSHVWASIMAFIADDVGHQESVSEQNAVSALSIGALDKGTQADRTGSVELAQLSQIISGFLRRAVMGLVGTALAFLTVFLLGVGLVKRGVLSLEDGVALVAVGLLATVIVAGVSLLWGMRPR